MTIISLDFAPDGVRACELNARMHRELGESLAHVRDASKHGLDFDEIALDRLISALRDGHNVSPGVFGTYYDLVRGIQAEDAQRVAAAFARLCAAAPETRPLQIIALDDPHLQDAPLYQRLLAEDESIDAGFAPPDPGTASAFTARLADGLGLMDRCLPELSAEIRAVVRQIVMAVSDPARAYQFDGGSHYQLWGALFLNAAHHPDALAVVEALAHECAHSLLFGFCVDEALVENDDDELYASPLRVDPRPMDGIYHATFVSARMHWAMSRLSRAPALSREAQDRAAAAAATDLQNFYAGYAIVSAHGRLTETGRGLMESARAHVDAAR